MALLAITFILSLALAVEGVLTLVALALFVLARSLLRSGDVIGGLLAGVMVVGVGAIALGVALYALAALIACVRPPRAPAPVRAQPGRR